MGLADKILVGEGGNAIFAQKAGALVMALEPVIEALEGGENLAGKVAAAMTPERCESLSYGDEARKVGELVGKPALEKLRAALLSVCYTPGKEDAVNDRIFREQFGYARGYIQCLTA